MSYRLLNEGEKIQAGDEWFHPKKPHASAWTEVEHDQVGHEIGPFHYPHRRRASATQTTGPTTTIRVKGWTGGAAPTARRLMECLRNGGLLSFEWSSVTVFEDSPHDSEGLGVTAAAYNRIVEKLSQCEKDLAEARADAEHDVREILALARKQRDVAEARVKELEESEDVPIGWSVRMGCGLWWDALSKTKQGMEDRLNIVGDKGAEVRPVYASPRTWLTSLERAKLDTIARYFDGSSLSGWSQFIRGILARNRPPKVRRPGPVAAPAEWSEAMAAIFKIRDEEWIKAIGEAGTEVGDE